VEAKASLSEPAVPFAKNPQIRGGLCQAGSCSEAVAELVADQHDTW